MFMNDTRYEIDNIEKLMNEFQFGRNEELYTKSSFIRNKVEAFIQDLSLHINSKKVSEYPALYKLIHKDIYDKYTNLKCVIGVQYKIENNKIFITSAKFYIL